MALKHTRAIRYDDLVIAIEAGDIITVRRCKGHRRAVLSSGRRVRIADLHRLIEERRVAPHGETWFRIKEIVDHASTRTT